MAHGLQEIHQGSKDQPGESCVRAKSLQSCLTLCDPVDCSPPGSSSVHGILTEVGCHALLQGTFPTQEVSRIGQAGSLPLAPARNPHLESHGEMLILAEDVTDRKLRWLLSPSLVFCFRQNGWAESMD